MQRFSMHPLCVLFLFSLTAKASDNWPEFRGPLGNGHAVDSPLPIRWSESENIRWKTKIHGRGWSSPVVWGDQIWLTTATEDGKEMSAVCVDRHTGQVVHDLLVFKNKEPRFCHPTNSYASPTPVIEEGRVYVHFGSYGTAAIDTTSGKTIWERRDLECNHWRGPGSSPILYDGKLYVAYDGFDYQYLVAFDKSNGKTVWKKDRNIEYESNNGDHRKAYSTCLVVDYKGRKQLVSPSAMETISYDPQTGDELWRVRHGGMNAASRPVFCDGTVYVVIGDAGPTICAVKADGQGAVTESHVQWMMQAGGPKRPSLIINDDLLYMVSDDGIARCVDAKNGETIWKKRLGGKFRSSPILCGDRVYFFDMDSKAHIIKAGKTFELITTNQLDHGCQASCAVSGDSLIVRTTKNLYCIENSK